MILIVDCGSQKTPDILKCVQKYGHEGQVISLDSFSNSFIQSNSDFEPISVRSFEKVIISGAPILLSQIENPSHYIEQAKAIIALDIPILGICFGHQIVGMAYGTKVFMGAEDRMDQNIQQVVSDPIFEGLSPVFSMREDHCEYIQLPEEFILLASSEITQNEVMKHASKTIYGCQFHPEVSGEIGQTFIQNFLEL